tara:strand:+ start:11450 stop:11941 length:492 start_codon:yes stop_codon:yes gene_type:complete
MIQVTTETGFNIYINTEANRINTTVASTQIRHLMKFTNDLDGSVFYAYAATETIYSRYTKMVFTYIASPATPNIYTGQTRLLPAGYYKYEAYEVSWTGTVTVSSGNAPATEDDVLSPAAATKGIVQGLVAIGKMNVSEKSGTEEVQYTQHAEPSGTNYIYYGQ